jgi:hypothetical protein
MYCGIKYMARGGCASLAGILIVVCAAVAPGCNAVDEPEPNGAVGDDSASGVSDADFVSTPAGLMHRSCVHAVAAGGKLDAAERVAGPGGSSIGAAPCAYPRRPAHRDTGALSASGGGVVASAANPKADTSRWTEFVGGIAVANSFGFDWINQLTGRWQVPLTPRSYTGQTIYVFMGLEPDNGTAMMMMTAQYGPSAAGGGNFWGTVVWYLASTGNIYHSALQPAQQGDFLQGTMRAYECPDNSGVCTWSMSLWNFGGAVTQNTTVNDLNVVTTEVFRFVAKGAIDAINVHNCDGLPVELGTGATFWDEVVYMPGPTPFSSNDVTLGIPWFGQVNSSGCSFGVTDRGNAVDLFWD